MNFLKIMLTDCNSARDTRSECLHRAVAEAAGLSMLDAAVALMESGGEMTGLNA